MAESSAITRIYECLETDLIIFHLFVCHMEGKRDFLIGAPLKLKHDRTHIGPYLITCDHTTGRLPGFGIFATENAMFVGLLARNEFYEADMMSNFVQPTASIENGVREESDGSLYLTEGAKNFLDSVGMQHLYDNDPEDFIRV